MRPAILLLPVLLISPAFAGEKWTLQNDVILYEAVVNKTSIKILASERAFDPSLHKTTGLRNTGSENDPQWHSATVDGKPVVGTDQTLPPKGLPQLSRLTVFFGDKAVNVPRSLMNHVFLPHLENSGRFKADYADTIVSVSSDGKCVIVDLGVGDGGGTSTYAFTIQSDGKVVAGTPQRPEP